MVNDSEKQGGSAEGALAAKLVPLLVAFGPPVAVSGWLWSKIQDNVLVSILLLIGYWAVVGSRDSCCVSVVPSAISGRRGRPQRSTGG